MFNIKLCSKSGEFYILFIGVTPYECTPACKNNGVCIGHNKCQCTPEFRGKLCEKGNDLDWFLVSPYG